MILFQKPKVSKGRLFVFSGLILILSGGAFLSFFRNQALKTHKDARGEIQKQIHNKTQIQNKARIDIQKKNHIQNQSLAYMETACRKLQLDRSFKTPLHRAEKLNRLMDMPIDWILTDLGGSLIDLTCFRDKKMIILNFWATWCAPCIKELNSLSELATNYKEDIFVLAVSMEKQDIVKKFLERSFKGLSPELKIAIVQKSEKLKIFPEDQIPATYIFSKQGLLKIKQIGEKNWSDKNIVHQILN